MKTMLKSLAAIRTWMVALAVTFLSGATLASGLYSNSFASNDAMVPPGTYGEIVVPAPGFKATKFTGAFDSAATISGGCGSFASVISGGSVRTHTISGWFKVDSLDCTVYAALGTLEYGAAQNGYKVYCTSEGKLLIGKVNSNTCAWDPTTGQLTVPTELKADTWYYLTVAITDASRVATAVVFVNGVKVYDAATTFKVNLNGQSCQRFFIGAGVSAAGLYVDSDAVTDAETIKGWGATNPMVTAKMYTNPLASNGATVTPGAYGDIVVSGTGFEATKFARTEAIIGGNGSFASISSGGDIRTHTVSGWFMAESLDCVVYAAVNDIATAVWGPKQTGYRVYCTSEGKLQIGECHSETYAAEPTAGYTIEVPTELKANTWYYLTVAITHSANARTVTVKVFVNGDLVFDDASKTFKINVNGSLCERFCVGAGVAAAGLYIDSTTVSDAEVIKGLATNPELVEAAPANALVAMPSNYTQPNALFVPRGAYANAGLDAKDVTRMVTTFDVNGEDETYSGAMDESGAYPFAKDQEGSAAFADDKGMLHFRRGKIYEGEALVRYFVPCRKDDGSVGFWDLVEGKFYGNEGTGHFISSYDEALRLSYIQSSGKQYIDTGIAATVNTRIEASFNTMTRTGSWTEFFGAITGDSSANGVALRYYNATSRLNAFFCNDDYMETLTPDGVDMSNTDVQIVLQKNKLTVNGSDYKITTVNTPCSYNIVIFGESNNGAFRRGQAMKFYSFKMSEVDGETVTLIRDFVPARNADGVIGLIDIANGNKFYPNSGTGNGSGNVFAWGGIAYTVDGTALKLHEGTLAAEHLAGYTAVEKVDVRYELNAGAVTEYAVPLTLSEGVFALTDGEVKTVTVGGKLTINGGVTLKVDAIGTECDNFEVQSLDLSDATEDNPIVIEITSAVGMDWSAGATLIANTGLADGPCANIRIADNDVLEPVVKNGDLTIQMKSAAAHWTGEIGDNDPTNPGNWQERTVPTADTIVYFSGESLPNIPVGTPFTAKSVELNVTLAGDYDWRGLNPNIPLTGKIDLNGHSLTVANLTGDYEITDTTDTSADDATPGELHVDVEGGKTIENATVTLSGALKFVKDGEGTFAVATAQAYAGGTDVKGGTLKCYNEIYPGKSLTSVTVYDGGIFDIGGLTSNIQTILAGGTLANTLKNHLTGGPSGKIDYYGQIPLSKVIANSAIAADFTLGLVASGYNVTTLDLGGKELTISIASGKNFVLDNTEVTTGTLKTTGEGQLYINYTSCRAAETDFDLGSAKVSVNVATEVHDLTVRSGTTVSGNGVITINGAYRPLGATAPKVALKDGASFDLSTLDEALNLAETTTTYTDNTTILIDVGERELETNEKVVAWSAKPANVGGLTFKFVGTKLDGETVNAVVQDDGIYYPDVTTIVKATWTGAAGDGDLANTENWTCENALELPVPGALPGASTVVYLNGEIAFNVPSGATFAAGSVNANASLKGDTDWSGLNPSIPVSGTIDLNGHKLTVANLVGNYEVTDSSATVYERLEYIQSNGSQWIDTGVLPTYNMKAELDMKFDGKINGDYRMFGVNINNYIRFQMYCGASSFTCRIGGADNSTTLKIGAHNNRTLHTLEMDGTTAKYTCGETVKSTPLNTTLTQQASLYLFTTRTSAVDGSGISKNCSATFYGGKIWDGENLVRDFVPVKRVSDGAIGLLDLANLGTENEFYENKGTTAFTAGATTGRIMTKPGCDEEATPGEFHINVASGSIKNTAVTFTGTTRVVKDGAGILELGAILQSNVGGWEIAEGTVKAIASPYSKTSTFFGEPGSTVVVREGAIYDLNKQYDTRYYPFILDGGTIANRGGDEPASSGSMGPITLTKNSNFDVTYSFPLWGKVDLGGLTLTVNIADGKSLYLYKDGSNVGGIFENGTVVTSGGGYFAPNAASGTSRDMRTVDFRFEGPLAQTTSIDVRNLTMVYDDTKKSGTGKVNIYGTFTPSAKNYIHNFVMQDGSTLNLAGRAGIYDVTSSVVTGNSNVLGFADGATINIVPGDKRTGKVVSWTEATKPADTVKFVADRKYGRLEVKDDGIYLHYGLLITIQ